MPASKIWTIKSKPLRVMRQMSTFWNHNKEYFHILKNKHNQRIFILTPIALISEKVRFQNKERGKLYFLNKMMNRIITYRYM